MNIIQKKFKPFLGIDADVKLFMIALALMLYSIVLVQSLQELAPMLSAAAAGEGTYVYVKWFGGLFSQICLVSAMFSAFCLMAISPTNKSNTSLILTMLFLLGGGVGLLV